MAAVRASIVYGGVNIPVRCLPQSKENGGISFKTLHDVDKAPVKMPKFCTECGVEVTPDNMVKGYEVTKGNMVVFTDDEIKKAKGDRNPVIEIKKFVGYVDPLWTFDTHWLETEAIDAYRRNYQLFAAALEFSGLVGFGTSANWGRERPCYIWARGGGLVLTRMLTQDEYLAQPESPHFEISKQDVEALAGYLKTAYNTLEEEDLVSATDVRMKEMIGAKVSGTIFEVPEPEAVPEPTVANILDTMRDMVNAKKKSRKKVAA